MKTTRSRIACLSWTITSVIALAVAVAGAGVKPLAKGNGNPTIDEARIPNKASRLGESVLLECGAAEHELLRHLEASEPSMPVLVNWYKHYSLQRRSDKPIYAKYLANNIDYAPHISKEYEHRLQVVDKINLNISSLKAVDESLYECRLVLFDKAYADSQTGYMFYLQVHVAPEFEYPNEDIVYYRPNVPTRLYCYAKGKPAPRITWYRNDVLLNVNTSVLQETFGSGGGGGSGVGYSDEMNGGGGSNSLGGSAAAILGHDMYSYRCQVENIAGRIEHTFRVIRSGSLFFTEPLRNLTVLEGTILNWPCLAQSNADITYKWFKESVAVQSHLHRWSDRGALFQDGMLYLLETYRNDSGLYECHAYTANKRIEATAYLNVLYGPEIETSESPVFTFEGSETLTLDCVVRSNPRFVALEWFKDTRLLSNSYKYQILANNSLLVRNVHKLDGGAYYCACNNTVRRVVSRATRVQVVDNKRTFVTTLYVAEGESSFKLPCRLSSPAVAAAADHDDSLLNGREVNWFKVNGRMPSSARTHIDVNGSLVLRNVRTTDSGIYICKELSTLWNVDESPPSLLASSTTTTTIPVTQNAQIDDDDNDDQDDDEDEDLSFSAGKNKPPPASLLSTSLSTERFQPTEKLIRLNVIHNATSSVASVDSEEVLLLANQKVILDANTIAAELPPTPEHVQINQTKYGLRVTWTQPTPAERSPLAIEYFQLYYRELSDYRLGNGGGDTRDVGSPMPPPPAGSSHKLHTSSHLNNLVPGLSLAKYEWKTSEAIAASERSYFVDGAELAEGQMYEFQLVAFSIYSKSLPSRPVHFKYMSRTSNTMSKRPLSYQQGGSSKSSLFAADHSLFDSPLFSLNKLKNMSQLDVILVAIFIILVVIFIISVVACFVYRRSSRLMDKQSKGSDLDDWGFQNAPNDAFLSSSSLDASKGSREPKIYTNLKSKAASGGLSAGSRLKSSQCKNQYKKRILVNEHIRDDNGHDDHDDNDNDTFDNNPPNKQTPNNNNSNKHKTTNNSKAHQQLDNTDADVRKSSTSHCNEYTSVKLIKYNAKTNVLLEQQHKQQQQQHQQQQVQSPPTPRTNDHSRPFRTTAPLHFKSNTLRPQPPKLPNRHAQTSEHVIFQPHQQQQQQQQQQYQQQQQQQQQRYQQHHNQRLRQHNEASARPFNSLSRQGGNGGGGDAFSPNLGRNTLATQTPPRKLLLVDQHGAMPNNNNNNNNNNIGNTVNQVRLVEFEHSASLFPAHSSASERSSLATATTSGAELTSAGVADLSSSIPYIEKQDEAASATTSFLDSTTNDDNRLKSTTTNHNHSDELNGNGNMSGTLAGAASSPTEYYAWINEATSLSVTPNSDSSAASYSSSHSMSPTISNKNTTISNTHNNSNNNNNKSGECEVGRDDNCSVLAFPTSHFHELGSGSADASGTACGGGTGVNVLRSNSSLTMVSRLPCPSYCQMTGGCGGVGDVSSASPSATRASGGKYTAAAAATELETTAVVRGGKASKAERESSSSSASSSSGCSSLENPSCQYYSKKNLASPTMTNDKQEAAAASCASDNNSSMTITATTTTASTTSAVTTAACAGTTSGKSSPSKQFYQHRQAQLATFKTSDYV